ncbi:MAG: efflux RND transporter periplasmic adaptor subunit [Pseudomonadota bacterium]
MAFPPARVEVAAAEIRTLAPTADLTGSVISLNDSRLASEVEGVVIWSAEVGDVVAAGDVIVRLDPRLLHVAERRAQATVERLEADLRLREEELRRAQDLAKTNNASATLLDESLAARDGARAQLADARAMLERATDDLDRAALRAPFPGHVIERLASLGEYVSVGEPVLRLVDTQSLEIAVPIPIDLAEFLVAGEALAVRRGDRREAHPLRTVVPVGDPVSRMVEARLSAAPGDWLVGTPVTVSVPNATARTLVAVPRDALVERGSNVSVFRVTAEGTAEQLPVEVVVTVGLWVGIAEGITAGDRVIVRGAERLAPGQAVEVASD